MLCNIYDTKSLLLLSHLSLCLHLIGLRYVCLVSHWLPPDSRCHGLPPPNSAAGSPSAARAPPKMCICFDGHTWLHQQGDLEGPRQGPQLANGSQGGLCCPEGAAQSLEVTIGQDSCASLPGIGSQPASHDEGAVTRCCPGLSGLPALSRGAQGWSTSSFRHSLHIPLLEASAWGSSLMGRCCTQL